jgi:hypothetical protein
VERVKSRVQRCAVYTRKSSEEGARSILKDQRAIAATLQEASVSSTDIDSVLKAADGKSYRSDFSQSGRPRTQVV